MSRSSDPSLREGEPSWAHLPAEPQSVGQARLWVRSLCNESYRREMCEDAELVITELVSNAIKHAATEVRIEARPAESRGLRLSVIDQSARPIRRPDVDVLAESGRGLLLVDLLSTRWGVAAEPDGKQVWAELH